MNNAIFGYAVESLVSSTETISDGFLNAANEIAGKIAESLSFLLEGFVHSVKQAKDGAINLAEGVTGIILAPLMSCLIVTGIPLIALIWITLFILSAIAHTLSVPFAYAWCLYRKAREVFKPLPQISMDYFPEVVVPEPTLTPPVLVLSAIALMAGMEIDMGPAPQAWSPSYLPAAPQEEAQVSQVETIDVEAFRRGLEQQFNAFKPRRTWKEMILQNLSLPVTPSLEEPLALVYPQCEIAPDAQIQVIEKRAVRETINPFPTPTTSCTDEVERSLPVEVPTAPEFPLRPANFVLQRWDKGQLIAFCDRINAVKKGSITKYKRASKALLIKKIKEFYA